MQNECKYSFSILIYPHVSYRATNGSVISYQTIRNICINLDNKGESALNKRVCQPHKGATEKHNKVLWWLKWMNGRIYYYINTRNLTLLLSPSLRLYVSHSVLLSHVSCRSNSKGVTQVAYTQCGPAIGLSFVIVRQEQPIWFGLSMPWQPKTSIMARTTNRPWVKDIVGSRTDHDLGPREDSRRHASKCNNSD